MSRQLHQVLIMNEAQDLGDGGTEFRKRVYGGERLPKYAPDDTAEKFLSDLVNWDRLDEDGCGTFARDFDEVEWALEGLALTGTERATEIAKTLREELERAKENGDSFVEWEVY